MTSKKNKPVIPRRGTKQVDIDRLRGAVNVAKNSKLVEAIQAGGTPFKFQEKFIRSAFLKAYLSKDEMSLLFKLGWVVSTSGRPVRAWRREYPAFLKAYPNITAKIDKEINDRLAFLKAYGYRLSYKIKRTKKAKV
jgi:hypothetical protein